MIVCKECNTRTMVKRIGANSVYFECSCGSTRPGTAADRVVVSSGQQGTARSERYDALLLNAPFSRTMKRVDIPCDKCGLPYMTQVRAGDEEMIIRVCTCGRKVAIR